MVINLLGRLKLFLVACVFLRKRLQIEILLESKLTRSNKINAKPLYTIVNPCSIFENEKL